jgi:calcineurin-like phosphoesterase family protein
VSNIFFCSDHHFHHANILNFKRDDGTPLRVFDDVNHMNEYMVMQHNRVVKPNDKVYFLGDVAMPKTAEALKILAKMNGEKILIKGNHDVCKPTQYLEYFKDIRGVYHIDGFVMSHVPLHPGSLERWGINIHGHLHQRQVLLDSKHPDARYFNVCMEQLDDYQPISLEQIRSQCLVREQHSHHYFDFDRNLGR